MSEPTLNPVAKRLAKRAVRLLSDLEDAGYALSLVSGGGQPVAAIHPEENDLERDPYWDRKPNVYNLGNSGVGDMIAL